MIKGITKSHYFQLDGLRGWAIILVMIYHFGLEHKDHDSPGFLLDLSQFGWVGVDLFFVLSGFLITSILIETKNSDGYIKNFLGRRFLRIWPLYYACLLVFFIVFPAIVTSLPDGLESMRDNQVWFWTYLANWLFVAQGGFGNTSGGYFWSLAVEEQFYLVWPFVVLRLSESRLLRATIMLFCASLVLRLSLLFMGVAPGSLYTNTFTHLDGLVVGAAIAVCLRNPNWAAILEKNARFTLSLSLLGLLAIRWAGGSWVFWTVSMASFGYSLIAIMGGSILTLSLAHGQTRFWSLTTINKPMRLSGKYSYALYLAHVPIATICQLSFTKLGLWDRYPYEFAFSAFALTSFAISYFVAFLSWHLFEKRILLLKRYFEYSNQKA